MSLQCLGVHTDGGMRERIIIPARKLHPSQRLSLDQLALVETLGIGAHAAARAEVERGETVLVIGAGPIGLSVIQFARLAGRGSSSPTLATADSTSPRDIWASRRRSRARRIPSRGFGS